MAAPQFTPDMQKPHLDSHYNEVPERLLQLIATAMAMTPENITEYPTPLNLPAGVIRFNREGRKFEIWDGTDWTTTKIAQAGTDASGTTNASHLTTGTLSSDRLPTVPVTKGGTGATTASSARSRLGANNASNLTTGTLSENRIPQLSNSKLPNTITESKIPVITQPKLPASIVRDLGGIVRPTTNGDYSIRVQGGTVSLEEAGF